LSTFAQRLNMRVTIVTPSSSAEVDAWGQPQTTEKITRNVPCTIQSFTPKGAGGEVIFPMEREGVKVMHRGFFLPNAPLQHESRVIDGARTFEVITAPQFVGGVEHHMEVLLKEVQ